MHISNIETVINSLQKSQNAFTEILEKDDDYLTLQELPSRQNAANPHDIICGANLRARLGLKYGGQAIIDARLNLDTALQQFEEALSLIANPDAVTDVEIVEHSNEEKKSAVIEKSICQLATENAVALAIKFSASTYPIEEDNTASNVTARTADISDALSDDISNAPTPPILQEVRIENTSAQLSDLHELAEMSCYQIQGNTFSLRGAIAATVLSLVAMATVGVAYSQTALAAKYFFQ